MTTVRASILKVLKRGKNSVLKIYCYCPLNVMEKVPAEVKYPHSD
jgi:hypothetical protein